MVSDVHMVSDDLVSGVSACGLYVHSGCVGAGVGRARSVGLCCIFTEKTNYALFFGLENIASCLLILRRAV